MSLTRKTAAILLLCLTIILVALLAPQLDGLVFRPGESYQFQSDNQALEYPDRESLQFDLGGLGRIVGLIILWVILPASVAYFIISPTARRQIILRVLSISFSTFAMIVAIRWLASSGGCSNIQNSAAVMTGEGSGEISEVVFAVRDLPSFRYLGSLIMAVLIVMILYRAWRRIQFQKPDQLERIALEASSAAADLQAGANLEDTIKRCYFEMSMALHDYYGFSRETGMTPREFESSLSGMGLPLGNVARLTRLFEEVRYGSKVMAKNIESEAIDLLNAIVQDCEVHHEGGKQ